MVSGALKLLLEAGGFRVTVAASATEAASWPDAEPPDVMLLDISLPDGNGLDVIRELDARGMKPLSIWAMTGHADDETYRRCLAAGCAGVLIKPVPVQQLLRIVSEAAA